MVDPASFIFISQTLLFGDSFVCSLCIFSVGKAYDKQESSSSHATQSVTDEGMIFRSSDILMVMIKKKSPKISSPSGV